MDSIILQNSKLQGAGDHIKKNIKHEPCQPKYKSSLLSTTPLPQEAVLTVLASVTKEVIDTGTHKDSGTHLYAGSLIQTWIRAA